jgi:hypothetical protein
VVDRDEIPLRRYGAVIILGFKGANPTAVHTGGVLANNKSPSKRGSWLSSAVPVIQLLWLLWSF